MVAQHAQFHFRVLRTFQPVHGFFVGQCLTRKLLVVHLHNLIAGYQARTLGRTVLDDVLHMQGVLSDGELDAHARERSLQVVVGYLHILGRDIDGVGVQLR